MTNTLKWILAALLVAGGIALAVALYMRGDKQSADLALVDAFEAVHKQDVARKQAKLDKLKGTVDADESKIEALETQLTEKKEKLQERYEHVGLTSQEIADRFARIRL